MNEFNEFYKAQIQIYLGILVMILLLIGYGMFSVYAFMRLKSETETAQKEEILSYYQQKVVESELKSTEKVEEPETIAWYGTASYYSEAGCVGCSATLTMANGNRFNEMAMTLAFNKVPLGTMVKVRNQYSNDWKIAEVTDRGGFEDLGRIADLSLGLKEAINCTDLCLVEISLVEVSK